MWTERCANSCIKYDDAHGEYDGMIFLFLSYFVVKYKTMMTDLFCSSMQFRHILSYQIGLMIGIIYPTKRKMTHVR